MNRRHLLVLAILIAAAAAFHAWLLLAYPVPFVDEAWLAARAWGFLQTGRPAGPLDVGIFGRFEDYWVCLPYVGTAADAAALWLAGGPSLAAMRAVSLACGLVLLGAVYVIGARTVGPRVGLAGVALVALSRPFLYSAHLARPDIAAAMFGLVAVAIHVANTRKRAWVEALAAVSVGLAFESHPNGVIYGVAVAALLVYDEGLAVWRRAHAWGFAAGAAVSVGAYAAAHILPDPQTYFAVNRLIFGASHKPPLLAGDWHALASSFVDLFWLFATNYFALAPLVVAAVVALVARRTAPETRLVVLAAAVVAAFALLVPNKIYYYSILYSPPVDLLLAAFAVRCVDATQESPAGARRTGALVACCLLALAAVTNLAVLDYRARESFEAAGASLTRYVGPGDRVMGSQTYWFFLHDHTYFAWEALVYYRRFVPGARLEDAFAEYRPDLLVVDDQMRTFIAERPDEDPYFEGLRVPTDELRDFLRARGSLVGAFDNRDYGRIEVFRIRWS